ncbi:hypothetical protein D3C75_945590 [compost metagenome]
MATVTRDLYSYGRLVGTVTYASKAAYDADRRCETAKGRIGTIESDLKIERKRLSNPKYPAEYKKETAAIIQRLEAELAERQTEYQVAVDDFKAAGGILG